MEAENLTRLSAYQGFLLQGTKLVTPNQLLRNFLHASGLYRRETVEDCLKTFEKAVRKRWNEAYRVRSAFEKNNASWLAERLMRPVLPVVFSTGMSLVRKITGRPKQSKFSSLSVSQKRKRTADLTQGKYNTSSQLLHAAKTQFKHEAREDEVAVLKLLEEGKATDLLESYNRQDTRSVTVDDALGLISHVNLSVGQYNQIRSTVNLAAPHTLPSYYSILATKEMCYPSGIVVNETEARVPLQSLLEKTASRLLHSLSESALSCPRYTLFCKWGFDGSGGQSEYKQAFANSTSTTSTDATILITTLVPIRMTGSDESTTWDNTEPSSTFFCRPVRMSFEKETKEAILAEHARMMQEIDSLYESEITLSSNKTVLVQYKLFLTMIDGKVINAITNTKSAATCYICGAKPSDMNKLESIRKSFEPDSTTFEYGLSPLHARINFMQFLLKLSYRLGLSEEAPKGTRLSSELKEEIDIRKRQIQNKFREIGLIVDIPKAGFGSSNDGNTARRFFLNAASTSQITGISEEIISRFGTILGALNLTKSLIDHHKFKSYCHQTARIFVAKYGWFQMTPTVHKVLIHGDQILKNFLVPIGYLSEEAQEARNKDFKKYRYQFARKSSRTTNLEDIFKRFLITSDPCLSMKKRISRSRQKHSMQNELEENAKIIDLLDEAVYKTLSQSDNSDCDSDFD